MQTYINNIIAKLQNFVIIFLITTLIEPLFELCFLVIHNLIFKNIAGIEFSGVSIGSLLGFLLGFSKSQFYYGQYLLMIPVAMFFAIMLIFLQLCKKRISLKYSLIAATYVLSLLSMFIVTYAYKILHISASAMLMTYTMSALYWYSSTSLTWVVLTILRLV